MHFPTTLGAGKSKTNFLLVGFVLQSSFKSELQISVARQCRGGDEEDEVANLKQERNVLDVAVCLVRKTTSVPGLKLQPVSTSHLVTPVHFA